MWIGYNIFGIGTGNIAASDDRHAQAFHVFPLLLRQGSSRYRDRRIIRERIGVSFIDIDDQIDRGAREAQPCSARSPILLVIERPLGVFDQ
jgi:hypothetical protein